MLKANCWFKSEVCLHGLGGNQPGHGEFFEDILAGCIVNRGEAAHGPGDLIPLTPPEGLESEEDDDEDEGTYEDLRPFERGPEITETR